MRNLNPFYTQLWIESQRIVNGNSIKNQTITLFSKRIVVCFLSKWKIATRSIHFGCSPARIYRFTQWRTFEMETRWNGRMYRCTWESSLLSRRLVTKYPQWKSWSRFLRHSFVREASEKCFDSMHYSVGIPDVCK